jgi:hypothetical protein
MRYGPIPLVCLTLSWGCSHRAPQNIASAPIEPAPSCAVPPGANAGRRRVLVFSELNPWLEVIDSDVPSVVVYADGEVILARKGLRHANLAAAALTGFLESLQLDRLRDVPEYTSTMNVTDLKTTVIIWRDGNRMRSVSVYRPVNRRPEEERWGNQSITISAAPEAFVSAVERIRGFEPDGATTWAPETVELMLGPFDHSRQKPIPWPANWPGWNSSGARMPSTIGGNSLLPVAGLIFIDGLCWNQAIEVKKGLDSYTAVLLDGRMYSLSIRPLLPAEAEWKSSLPAAH